MRRFPLLLVGVMAVVAAGCSGNHDAVPAPNPGSSVTTAPVDLSGVALAGVPGATTSTIVEAGTASITGAVKGPGGLIVGATVRIERLVADREIRTDVLTGPDGRYALLNIPGGRYRVRAFRAPTLAQVLPEVQFLEDAQEHTVDLTVEQRSGLVVRADVAPEPPLLGGAVNLVAVVLSRTVGDDGVVRSTPVTGSDVELTGLGRWKQRDDGSSGTSSTTTTTIEGGSSASTSSTSSLSTTTTTAASRRTTSATARTDAFGRVRYELRCTAAGPSGLALRVAVTLTPPPDDTGVQAAPYVTAQSVALDLPDCVDPATTTTTTTTTQPAPTTRKP